MPDQANKPLRKVRDHPKAIAARDISRSRAVPDDLPRLSIDNMPTRNMV